MANASAESLERLRVLRRMRELRKERQYREARTDFFAFQACVMKGPDGEYWQPGDIHREWDEFFAANPRAVRWAPIEHGKTEQRPVARTLFEIGLDQNTRQGIFSETYTQARDIAAAVKDYIEFDEDYQRVFPDVKPMRGRWADGAFTVERSVISKNPTVLADGVEGSVQGKRFDRVVMDDVVSFKNSLNEDRRKKVLTWILSTLIPRVVETGRIEAIGTSWHVDDAMHKLSELPAYAWVKDRATTLKTEGGELTASGTIWPEQWSEARLLARRMEIGEFEFSRQMLNEPLVDGMSRFKMEWFEAAWAMAEELGHRIVTGNPGRLPAFTGVDLAIGKKSHHDLTVLLTAFLEEKIKRLACIKSGRMEGPKIADAIVEEKRAFNSMITVETNAAQDYMRQWVRERGEAVSGFVTTGHNKLNQEFGVESLAIELQQGMWSIPRCPETEALAREAVYYDPIGHTGDRLMAWWLCRESIRSFGGSNRAPRGGEEEPSEAGEIMAGDF